MGLDIPLNIQEKVPLAPLTTLKVGGPARFFVDARTEEDVTESLRYAASRSLEVFILGGGSNILVSDAGFDGLVVHIALKGVRSVPAAVAAGLSRPVDNLSDHLQPPATAGGTDPQNVFYEHARLQPPATAGGTDPQILVNAQAGEDWDKVVEYCVSRNLAGIECLSGIPGLVGGTPVQNVGAYGQEVSETIVSVRCLDRATDEVVELSNEECRFSYRTSTFNSTQKDRYVVLSVKFALTSGGRPKIVYKDLKEFFDTHMPTLAEARAAVLKIRAAKSMVIDPADPNSRSAGSFFKNPIVHRSKLAGVALTLGVDAVPHFETGGEMVKIPAAWLIERAGFHKGFKMGNAGISTNHSLALINCGGATADEILELNRRMVATVSEKFDIDLVPEPIFVGFGARPSER